MTDHELDAFEQQLRQTKPAKPPEDFSARLRATEPKKIRAESEGIAPSIPVFFRNLRCSLRWLIPATAVAMAVMVAWQGSQPFVSGPSKIITPVTQPSAGAAPLLLKADDVKIDQQLVSSFDAVARLPSGEPVRFRCENWMDQFVLSDKARGVVVENRRPRFEVVPVRYETY